ncbi:MAG: zinc ribbon domain-containing protein [Nitrososphaerales archaeon]
MASCPSCGKEISPQAISCPNCGHSLQAQTVPPPPKSTGATSPKNLAYYSIICGVVAILTFPIPLGVIGSALGILAIRRGQVTLGSIGLLLSVLFGFVSVLLVVLFS